MGHKPDQDVCGTQTRSGCLWDTNQIRMSVGHKPDQDVCGTQTRSGCLWDTNQIRMSVGHKPEWAIFSRSSQTSDLKTGTPVATLPDAWHSRVSAGTGWPGVRIL